MADLMATEPSADIRAMAAMNWQLFVALRAEGFTEAQALQLLGVMFSVAAANRPPEENDG